MVDVGQWLIEHRAEMDRAEAVWLERLAEFDRDGLWAVDGQLSCAGWLVWRTNMARSTAFEKLRVAHELERRPVVAEAFRQGRLSYSAVRAMTRLDRPDPDVDEALVELAQSGQASILDLERVVRSYGLYADQERPPPDDADRARDVKILRGDDGTGQVVVTLGDLEARGVRRRLPSVPGSPLPAPGCGRVFSRGHAPTRRRPSTSPAVRPRRPTPSWTWCARPWQHADGGRAAGDDRYLVHVVTRDGGRRISQLDGTPLHPADAAMITLRHQHRDPHRHRRRRTAPPGPQDPAMEHRPAPGHHRSRRRAMPIRRLLPQALRHSPHAPLGSRRQHRHRQRLLRLPAATTACFTTATASKVTPTASCASTAPTAPTSEPRTRPLLELRHSIGPRRTARLPDVEMPATPAATATRSMQRRNDLPARLPRGAHPDPCVRRGPR